MAEDKENELEHIWLLLLGGGGHGRHGKVLPKLATISEVCFGLVALLNIDSSFRRYVGLDIEDLAQVLLRIFPPPNLACRIP